MKRLFFTFAALVLVITPLASFSPPERIKPTTIPTETTAPDIVPVNVATPPPIPNPQPVEVLAVTVPDEPPQYTQEPCRIERTLPEGSAGSFKAFMDYRRITYRNSIQWRLQQYAWTDCRGFRRYGEMYMIALGTYYTPTAGRVFDLELSTGTVIRAIVGDIKANGDTDTASQRCRANGSIVEFIVDTRAIYPLARRMGCMSFGGMCGYVVGIWEVLE